MNKVFTHNAFFRLLFPPTYGIVVYLLILLINNNIDQLSVIFMGQEVYVCIGLTYIVFEVLRLNGLVFHRLFKGEINVTAIAGQMTSGLVLSLGSTTGAISAYYAYVLQFSITPTELIIFNSIFAVSGLLYNLVYFSNVYMYRENLRKLEQENDLKDALESDLIQFKNEVNPNLLYDSLETLITLIHQDEEESEEYIDNLSSVYRYILTHRKIEFSTLEKEIAIAQKIIKLLNYKFDNNVSLKVNTDAVYTDTPVAPGAIPSIIESIIRSSIINKFQPLVIEIGFEDMDGYIVIQHKLNERLKTTSNEEQVFENIQKTYSFYAAKPVIKIKAYGQGYIKIPLLELQEEGLAV